MRIAKGSFSEIDRIFLFNETEDGVYCSELHKEFFPILLSEKSKYETVGAISYQRQGLVTVGTISFTGNFLQDIETFLTAFPNGDLAIVSDTPLEVLPYCDVISDRVVVYLNETTYEELVLTLKNLNEHC